MSDSASEPFEPIYPDPAHPYYIVAPPYTRTSAGVRVLHLLCHSLNRRGRSAYVLLHPRLPWRREPFAPDLLTPPVTRRVIQTHFERGRMPIVVYPELFAGNPFGAPCVVRYVLNFPGLLGGDKDYAPEELCYSYSKILAAQTRSPDNVLFLPATDTRVFNPPAAQPNRSGTCFYAHKYQHAYKGKLFPVTANSVEITRGRPDSPTPEQIAALFRRSELFYAYENTALAAEAVLCGCPTVFLPNPYLSDIIAVKELGPEGYAWGDHPAEVERAKTTVLQGAKNYLRSYDHYWRELDCFIDLTQKHAAGKTYLKPMRPAAFRDTLEWALARRGLRGLPGRRAGLKTLRGDRQPDRL